MKVKDNVAIWLNHTGIITPLDRKLKELLLKRSEEEYSSQLFSECFAEAEKVYPL